MAEAGDDTSSFCSFSTGLSVCVCVCVCVCARARAHDGGKWQSHSAKDLFMGGVRHGD